MKQDVEFKFMPILWAVIFLTVLSAGLSMPTAIAQEPESTPDPYAMENVPDEYIEEALAFYEQCTTSIEYNRYHNCECLSAKYLDKRIELGPATGESSIMMSIEEQCPDATQAAGYYYERCMTHQVLNRVNMPIEEYCECFANEYGKIYERLKPEPNSQNFVAIQSIAMRTCANPNRAVRLNSSR